MADYCLPCKRSIALNNRHWIWQKDVKAPSGKSKRCRLWRNFTRHLRGRGTYRSFEAYCAWVLMRQTISPKVRKRQYDARRLQDPQHREKRLKAQRAWFKTPKGRAQVKRANAKRLSTPHGKIAARMRAQINARLRGVVKGALRHLPYTMEQLKSHLEQAFKADMNWDNRPKWDIDHIIPLMAKRPSGTYYWNQEALLDPTSPTFQAAWALDNLQPLWKSENCRKSNKLLKNL